MTSIQAIKLLKRYGNDQEDVMELYRIIENELDEALAELEELKKDVARFMVLLNIYLTDTQTTEEMHERWALERKLTKVGNKL